MMVESLTKISRISSRIKKLDKEKAPKTLKFQPISILQILDRRMKSTTSYSLFQTQVESMVDQQ